MSIKAPGSEKLQSLWAIAMAIALMLGVSSYVHSQSESADPLEELLWLAAEALRNGDLKTTREILELASATEDNPAPELLFLMDQLKQATHQQGLSSAPDDQQPDALIQSAREAGQESRFANLQSLDDYLKSLSDATDALVSPRN